MTMPEQKHISFSEEQLSKGLKAVGVICVGVLTLLLLVKTINEVKTYSTIGEDTSASAQYGTITVSGNSELFVKPDVTTFTVSIDSEGSTAEQSSANGAIIENKVVAFLKSKGIQENDLKTTNYYTSEKYGSKFQPCTRTNSAIQTIAPAGVASSIAVMPQPCGTSESVITGYQTNESIEVKVRNIKDDATKVGEIVKGVQALGAKASNPQSTVDKPEIFKNKVREEAIIKARNQAELLAKQLGVKLVRVTAFSENAYPYYPVAYDMMSARAKSFEEKAPVLPTGTNKITAEVSITYQIR